MTPDDATTSEVSVSSSNAPAADAGGGSDADKAPHRGKPTENLPKLVITALGVVFGDIGTSPLYTLKTVLDLGDSNSNASAAIGVLSLIIWTLTIIVTLKYVTVAMRVDNNGEGGILALMALLGIKKKLRPAIIVAGLFGAALIYGDGAITPAISVLSALEGLDTAAPPLQPYIVPIAVVILIGLFAIQPNGTAKIGQAFGPIMLLWFATIAFLGFRGLMRHPGVLVAINPMEGLSYLAASGRNGLAVLGGVFLCATGAEALYADMGHFGAKPIRIGWYCIAGPALILNYAGQTALVVDGFSPKQNIFYALCPPPYQLLLIGLATVATIIASQSIITGAFSMTRQAIQLGWLPPMVVKQTSEEGYGQIYVGAVNWLLMATTIGLVLFFRSSDRLASAYGIAISATMVLTSCLLYMAMIEIGGWPKWRAVLVAGFFLIVDVTFFIANSLKFFDGGYIPVFSACLIFSVMLLWRKGSDACIAAVHDKIVPVDRFMADIAAKQVPRTSGAAVFLSRSTEGIPPVMRWHVRQNKVLNEKVVVFKIEYASIPWVSAAYRFDVVETVKNYWQVTAHYGFMERPDIPQLVAAFHSLGYPVTMDECTYYLGHEAIRAREDGKGMPHWQLAVYTAMQRNSAHVIDFFRLPADSVVEIGRTVDI